MTTAVDIMRVPLSMLPFLGPHCGNYLARGAATMERDPLALASDIAKQLVQVWIIIVDGRPSGAFLTSIKVEETSRQWLDVFGLAGEGITIWGRQLAARMTAFARSEDCARIVFCGRPGLERAYGGNLNQIGTTPTGEVIFERVVQ